MNNEWIHPSLKRRIQQQLAPAFGRGWQTASFNLLADAAPAATRRWPEPPPAYKPFHSPALMQHLWNRLLAVVDSPLQTVQLTPGWRAVQLTGCAVFVQAANRRTQLLLWQHRHNPEVGLFQVEEHLVIVTETPYRMLWLQCLEQLALADIVQFYRQQSVRQSCVSVESYGRWMFGQFTRVLPGVVDLRRMRQRCAAGLQLPTALLQTAHRINLVPQVPGKASLTDFNRAVRHAPTVAQLQHDAPALLPLFGALCDLPGFPAQGEPLSRIRQQLRTMQLSGYVWHLLLKAGSRLLLPMREFYSSNKIESVRDYLWILERLRVRAADPPGVLRLLFSEFGHSHSRRANYWPSLQPHQAAWAHLLSALRTAGTASPPTEEQMALVVRWITSNSISGWNRAQRQRGWPWLLASAQAWQTLELRQQHVIALSWPVPFDTLAWGDLSFSALASAAGLIVHGHVMRNCAATLVSECKAGALLLVAVSRPADKCVATVSYRIRDGAWKLCGAKGPANRELDQTLLRPLYHFAKRIPVTAEVVEIKNEMSEKDQKIISNIAKAFQ